MRYTRHSQAFLSYIGAITFRFNLCDLDYSMYKFEIDVFFAIILIRLNASKSRGNHDTNKKRKYEKYRSVILWME